MNKRLTILKLVAACSLPMLFTGCASYMVGSTQKVPLRTTPPGAAVTVYNHFNDTVFEGVTPCTVDLRRGNEQHDAGYYKVVFHLDGYAPTEVLLTGHINRAYVANVPFGLIGAATVDPATGAMWTLTPEQVQAKLQPIPVGSQLTENNATHQAAK
jgi:hypothetical protein